MPNSSMARFAKWFTLVILLLLSWAALDDITTGFEPGFSMELGVLIVTAVYAAWLVRPLWFKIMGRS